MRFTFKMICDILGIDGGGSEEYRLLGCGAGVSLKNIRSGGM
jgi:hypothetical protein